MSAILGTAVTGAGGGGYTINNSVRLRASASASLSKTYSATRTSGTTITYSTWIKRGILGGGNQTVFFGYDGSSAATSALAFSQDSNTDKITFQFGGSSGTLLATTAVYRDPSAWYHIVLAIDTTQATDTNRVKLYVNGSQVTSFSTTYYPSQNATHQFLLANSNNGIGYRKTDNNSYFDGYMAETYCIDGQALTPSSFGETSSDTGVWKPKSYTGTYGTNGFYLKFSDIATTSGSNAGLGKDFSGNGNYWNTNNISVTAGSTYDSMTDVPTLTSATASNFATLNPVAAGDYFVSGQTSITLTGANLNYGTGGRNAFGTIAVSSGKYYWEMSNTSNTASAVPLFGLVTIAARASVYGVYYQPNGNKGLGTLNSGATETSYGATWTDNDVIGVALDMDAATPTVTYYKNNASQGAISVSSFVGQSVMVWIQNGANSGNMAGWINHGQRPFAYTPPSGYVALNTFNLPTPTIGATASTQANKYFDATLWTGDGTNGRAITNAGGFQPDLVWAKARSSAIDNWITDSVRGASKQLSSNLTDAEATYNLLSSFNSNGFSVNGGTYTGTNQNGTTYVGWQWKANGTGVTNTAGSITSTVSANTSAGFSVVTWTGVGGLGTVGHGLGVAPKMIIVMPRSFVSDKYVYHASIGAANYVSINLTSASASTTLWNSTSPTSSVFTVNGNGANQNTSTYVGYCFSEVAGYSKFGSYTGNGSTDGPFIYCGFRPRYIFIKRTDSTSSWRILDTARSPYNAADLTLYTNLSDADVSGDGAVDLNSNGFKIRNAYTSHNASGGTYIFAAFAETPTKFALAR